MSKMRVWWNPQIGSCETMYVPVKDDLEAKKVLDVLSVYDMFQYKNNIKGDYSNAGGVEIFEDGEWCDWYKSCSNSYYDDIDEYIQEELGIEENGSIYAMKDGSISWRN